MTNWKKKAKLHKRLLDTVVRQSATMRRLLIEYVDHDDMPRYWDEYEQWRVDWLKRVRAELLHWVTGEVDAQPV
jgi:hypothetical protein